MFIVDCRGPSVPPLSVPLSRLPSEGLTVRTRDLVWRSYVVFFCCCVVRRKRTLDFHSRGSGLTEREGIPLYTWNTAISRWIENREEGFFYPRTTGYARHTRLCLYLFRLPPLFRDKKLRPTVDRPTRCTTSTGSRVAPRRAAASARMDRGVFLPLDSRASSSPVVFLVKEKGGGGGRGISLPH